MEKIEVSVLFEIKKDIFSYKTKEGVIKEVAEQISSQKLEVIDRIDSWGPFFYVSFRDDSHRKNQFEKLLKEIFKDNRKVEIIKIESE